MSTLRSSEYLGRCFSHHSGLIWTERLVQVLTVEFFVFQTLSSGDSWSLGGWPWIAGPLLEARTQTVAGDGRSWPVAFRKFPLFLSFKPPLLKPLILAFVCFFIHCLNKCTRPFKITGAAPEGTLERCDIPGNPRWLLKNGYVKDRRTRMGETAGRAKSNQCKQTG